MTARGRKTGSSGGTGQVAGGQPPDPRDISQQKKPGGSIPEHIKALIAREIAQVDPSDRVAGRTLEAFRGALREPRKVRVNFSGGHTQACWSVTRTNGDYRVIFLPRAGYFSLCVESDFGPLDIGVHGPALGCFSSV